MEQPFNIIGQAYADEVLPLAAQECINWIPETVETEGGRNVIALKGAPGAELFGTAGTAVRGMFYTGTTFYVVSGTSLYSVTSGGVATSLGTVAGTGRVCMTHNGTQLVMVNGTEGYVYDEDAATFNQITDPDFQPASTCAFLDQYIIFDGNGGQFFISALADATDYDSLDFASAESAPDDTIAVIVDHLELWVFGTQSIEIWTNTGDPDFPFERNSGVVVERGCGAKYSVQKMDNTVYWLGEDGIVYAAAGYAPQRISTHAIEQQIQSADYSDAFAFTYRDQGHWYYVITVSGKTWAFDASTRMWHRRKTYNRDGWRAQAYAFAFNKHLIGDDAGNIYELRHNVYADGDDPLVAERKTQYAHQNSRPIFGHRLELTINAGFGNASTFPTDPTIELRWSDDFGNNFTDWKQRSMGKVGQYARRARWLRLGRFYNRLFHIRVSDPVPRDLVAADARFDVGQVA